MTQEQLEYIINSDLPVNKKSELIKGLYDAEHKDVSFCKEGGELDSKNELSVPELTQIVITIETGSEKPELPEPDATITIGDKSYDVCIADTPEKRHKGLSECKELPEDGGMLFVFEEETDTPFTMKDTSIDLDIIFIDEDGEVIEVHSVKAHDPEPVKCSEPYIYVLEVNYSSGVQEGDGISIEGEDIDPEDKKKVNGRMLVLNSDGDVQMKIDAGCRIFSRVSTRRMIKKALQAFKNDTEADYRKVGRYVFYELNLLDLRKPLYTKAPENNNKNEE